MCALALFFCVYFASVLYAGTERFDASIGGYVTRMLLALLLLAGAGYAFVKYLPGRFRMSARGRLRLVEAISLGRDAIYVVQVGPEIVALFVGRAGANVLGRWRRDEWESYEAELSVRSSGEVGSKDGR